MKGTSNRDQPLRLGARLELEPQREANVSLGSLKGLVDPSEITGTLLGTNLLNVKLGRIEGVEELRPELQTVTLVDREILEQPEVHIVQPWAVVAVVPKVTVGSCRRAGHCGGIKPKVGSPAGRRSVIRISASQNIRTRRPTATAASVSRREIEGVPGLERDDRVGMQDA